MSSASDVLIRKERFTKGNTRGKLQLLEGSPTNHPGKKRGKALPTKSRAHRSQEILSGNKAKIGKSEQAPSPALLAQQRAYNLQRLGDIRARKISILVFSLCVFGVVMVFAASAVTAAVNGASPLGLVLRQVLWAICGGLGYFVCSKIPLQKVRDLAKPALLIAGSMLFIVLIPGISKSSGGASRWIGIGPIDIQPSELAKLAFAIFTADLIAKRRHSKHYVQDLVLPIALMAVILGIMIMRQPDLGTTIMIISIGLVELGVSHLPRKIFLSTLATALVSVLILSLLEPYRIKRLLSFINPFAHSSGSGYQLVQSILALGQGHISGAGLASSPMAWGLLPNAQTDFIFSVIGNDTGLIGTLSVIAAFTCLFIMGVKVAMQAEDSFSSHLAIGLVALICGQAFLNIAGVIGILPETGIPLPFFSSGGSSLIVVLLSCGLLVNISRHYSSKTIPRKSRFQRSHQMVDKKIIAHKKYGQTGKASAGRQYAYRKNTDTVRYIRTYTSRIYGDNK